MPLSSTAAQQQQHPTRAHFCLSASSTTPHNHHNHALLQRGAAAESVFAARDSMSWHQLAHLHTLPLPLPPHTPQQHNSKHDSKQHTAALACRYYTSSPGFLFPQRSEVPKQAFGFSPLFSLKHTCHSASSNASSALGEAQLSHDSVVALRPTTELVQVSSRSPITPPTAARQHAQQHQRHQQHDQQQSKRRRKSLQAEQQEEQKQQAAAGDMHKLPWLGAQLDVGGYSKKGFISGGGKDQNQDRGLILEAFRGPSELLLGVFDGHGTNGHQVSTFLAQHLPAVLLQKLVAAAAAAAAFNNTSSSSSSSKQRRLFGRGGSKQDKQQQQQQQVVEQLDWEFGVSHVPYVVVPDHHQAKYGLAAAGRAAAVASGGGPSSAHHQNAGRAVGKQQLVQQQQQQPPLQSHSLSDLAADTTGTSSSSSSSSSSSTGHWLAPVVSAESVQQVPLRPSLLTAAFTATDWLLSGSGINVVDSGSTAVLCHIGPSSITTAWVGDSRAVLGRRKQGLRLTTSAANNKHSPQQQQSSQQASSSVTSGGQPSPLPQPQQQSQQAEVWEAVTLSVDHKPERHDEHLRITLSEGRVDQIMGRGPYRVWFKGIDYPGLAMSRAFGDLPCRRIGVTCEPEVSVQPLKPNDQLLIVASDGVWDVFSNEEAVALAAGASGAQAAARSLVEVAEGRWLDQEGGYVDDITAVVVRVAGREVH